MIKAYSCVIGVWNVWGRAVSRAGDGSQVSMPTAACLSQLSRWGFLHIAHASAHLHALSNLNSAWTWWLFANMMCSVFCLSLGYLPFSCFLCFSQIFGQACVCVGAAPRWCGSGGHVCRAWRHHRRNQRHITEKFQQWKGSDLASWSIYVYYVRVIFHTFCLLLFYFSIELFLCVL